MTKQREDEIISDMIKIEDYMTASKTLDANKALYTLYELLRGTLEHLRKKNG